MTPKYSSGLDLAQLFVGPWPRASARRRAHRGNFLRSNHNALVRKLPLDVREHGSDLSIAEVSQRRHVQGAHGFSAALLAVQDYANEEGLAQLNPVRRNEGRRNRRISHSVQLMA